jgi:hypothetical protein
VVGVIARLLQYVLVDDVDRVFGYDAGIVNDQLSGKTGD